MTVEYSDCYNCSNCFKYKYLKSEERESICRYCKEKNGMFYEPDLTTFIGWMTSTGGDKNDNN